LRPRALSDLVSIYSPTKMSSNNDDWSRNTEAFLNNLGAASNSNSASGLQVRR